MTGRLRCCVPFCRRTTARFQPPTEWLCGDHWRLLPKDKRRVYGRRKRAWRRYRHENDGVAIDRLWAHLKREAIERAAGGVMKHRWDPKPHRTTYRTTRTCTKCGLQKVTRHDGDMPWIEFWRDEALIPGTKTPACEPVKEEATST